ncbi:TIGR00295 family protein [Candidatus Bathyarchaeota archaeon]|nr:MAG: TIGR00295 family protein [Candidatus Bathyarchaeota archaeon]
MSEELPSKDEALRMLREAGCSEKVVVHCLTVMRVAEDLAKQIRSKGHKINIELVRIGALLHDIGRSKTHSVNHAVVGGEIARSLGLPESVIHIIERHVGGGITRDEAKKLGWPDGIYMPQTLEEKVVTYADKLVDGSRRVPLESTLNQLRLKLGDKHPAIKRIKELEEEIKSLLK